MKSGINLRPCLANGEKALFHRWHEYRAIIEPSVLRGGHAGGQISELFAIVEFEDGSVKYIRGSHIRFIDSIFNEYAFCDTKNTLDTESKVE